MSIPFPVRNMVISRPQAPARSRVEVSTELLSRSPIFEKLPLELLRELATVSNKHEFAADSFIFRQGDPGQSLFIIDAGSVQVIKDGHTIAELGRGSLFGEMSLLTGAVRSASIQAGRECSCLELSKEEFALVAGRHPTLLDELGTILTERQLSGQEALEKARAEAKAQGGDTHTLFKGKLLSMMRGFLGVGAAKKP